MAPDGPLGIISPHNQSGLILILTALSLCFVLVSFAIRIYVRVPKGLWKSDDYVLTVATILSCIQSSLVFYEVHIGLGNDDVMIGDQTSNELLRKYYFANDFLYLFVLFFSKAAIGFLYLRLTRARGHVIVIWSILGACLTWLILSILLISVGCSWKSTFNVPFGRWLAVGVIDCATELAITLNSVYLVKDLRMSIVRKGTVIFAFALRLLAVPACALRLYYLNPDTLSGNHSLAISLAVVCTEIQLGYGIMAASVTVLKPFMVVYENPPGYTANTYYHPTSGKHSFKLSSIRSKGEDLRSRVSKHTPGFVSPNPVSYSVTVSHVDNKTRKSGHERTDSIHSHDSRRMIIERQTDWSVRYEEADSANSGVSDAGRSS